MIPIGPTAESLMSALGAAVLHFMWQGTLIGMLGAALLATMRRGSAPARYAVGCAAMGCCVLSFLTTFVLALIPGSGQVSVLTPKDLAAAVAPGTGGSEWLLDAVAWTWLAGFIVLAARLAVQSYSAHRLATASVTCPDEHWQRIFDDLKAELGIGRAVRFLRSAVAESPMVVGWISPVVLAPVSAFTTLTPDQLRALLVHELAHIRRYDHLVNAAQVVIETVLFFHPIVWWLSGRVRLEREHCCDDAAVRRSASPRVLAEALVKLESLRIAHPQAALAANGGPLMNRISRLLGTDRVSRTTLPGWRTAVGIAAGAFVAAAVLAQPAHPSPTDDQVVQMLRDMAAAGSPTEEVRDLYHALVYAGSEQQQKVNAELAAIENRINAAVKDGKVSRADADARLEGARKGRQEERVDLLFRVDVLGMTRGQAHTAIMREKLERAVQSGRMTREEAERQIAAIERENEARKEHERLSDAERKELEAADREVRAAVAAGKMTRAEAVAKMDELKRRMNSTTAADVDAAKSRGRVVASELSGAEKEAVARKRLASAEAEIKTALEAGKITREQADERLEAIKKRIAESGTGQSVDLDAIKRRVEGAVERGDLTREQADETYRKIKERAGPAR